MQQFQNIAPFQELSCWLSAHIDCMATSIPTIDALVRNVAKTGLLTEALIISEATHHIPDAGAATNLASSKFVRIVVDVPNGVGVMVMRRITVTPQGADQKRASTDGTQFVSFADCEPPVQSLIVAALPSILTVLHQRLRQQITELS